MIPTRTTESKGAAFVQLKSLHRDISFCPPPIDCRMRACLDPRTMTPLPAKVTAIGKQGQQYRAVVQIRSKYRGSVTILVFGELTKTAHRFLEKEVGSIW